MSGNDEMTPEERSAMVSEFGMMPVPENAVAIVSFTPVLVDGGRVQLKCEISQRPYVRTAGLVESLRKLADKLEANPRVP